MDKYFEEKKRKRLIFTMDMFDPRLPNRCMAIDTDTMQPVPVTEPDGPSYWSRASGRYRSYEEQQEYIKTGRDRKLPEII